MTYAIGRSTVERDLKLDVDPLGIVDQHRLLGNLTLARAQGAVWRAAQVIDHRFNHVRRLGLVPIALEAGIEP